MEFRILGPLEAWDGGKEIAVGGPKQRALLALLLLRRGVLQTLLAAGAVGLFASVAGAPLPH